MTISRIIVGLAALLASATPLYLLSRVTYGVGYGYLTGIYEDSDMKFPFLARILWPFGPLDWWSYITPVALAVGVAASVRFVFRTPILIAMLAFSVIQSVVIVGAFEPFEWLGRSMAEYLEPPPYPMRPLLINVAMVVTSSLYAVNAVWRASGNRSRRHINQQGEKAGNSDGG